MKTPYDVREQDFPFGGPWVDQETFLLRYAILAPSTHNTQPWRFVLAGDGIEIFADYGRRLPIVDPGNRELLMSIGAAVFNLRVAASRFGVGCRVQYNRSGDSEGPLVSVALAPLLPRPAPDPRLDSLFSSIPKRHTNRSPFLLSRIPSSVLREFQVLSGQAQPSLFISTDGKLNQQVGDLVATAERLQQGDPAARKDLAGWVRTDWTGRGDGIPGSALGVKGVASAIAPWAARAIDLSRIRAAADKNLCIEAPALIVVESEDATEQWLEAGELLERLLLTITREGLQCSYFNMAIQVPSVRLDLRDLLGLNSRPQLLLRVGYCLTEPVLSPRRPLDEVIIDRSAASALHAEAFLTR